MRCYLRAEANECIRRFPNVELTGVSGIYGRSRTVVEVGVVSFLRITPTSTHVRISARERLNS